MTKPKLVAPARRPGLVSKTNDECDCIGSASSGVLQMRKLVSRNRRFALLRCRALESRSEIGRIIDVIEMTAGQCLGSSC